MNTPQDPRIAFLHVPKCGGTSVLNVFLNHFPGDKVFPGYSTGIRGADMSGYRFIAGHFGYDDIAPHDCQIVSLLRDPVERFLSHYYYWHHRGINGSLSGGNIEIAANHSLEDVLDLMESGTEMIQLDNMMTWIFVGHYARWKRRALAHLPDDDLLELAKQNILSCAVVGRLEDMTGFAADIKRVLGLDLTVPALNRNAKRKPMDQVPQDTLARIRNFVSLDIRLYDWLTRHLAGRQAQPGPKRSAPVPAPTSRR